MADLSTLCFSSPFHHTIPSFSLSSSSPSSSFNSFEASKVSLFPSSKYSIKYTSSRVVRSHGKDSEDVYGAYPWDPLSSSDADQPIQWIQEDRITLFTTDGLVQLGGSMVPRRVRPSDRRQGKTAASQRLQRFVEHDYMDPNQGLCLGALFDIAATNGLDTGRRLCIFGFCRSIEMLSDVVEDTVLEHGGEVVAAEKASKGGLQEKLKMIVAVPLLWGVPPASDTLRFAVRNGGGIVEKIYWQWNFL